MVSYLGLLIWILLRFVIVALRCLGLVCLVVDLIVWLVVCGRLFCCFDFGFNLIFDVALQLCYCGVFGFPDTF